MKNLYVWDQGDNKYEDIIPVLLSAAKNGKFLFMCT